LFRLQSLYAFEVHGWVITNSVWVRARKEIVTKFTVLGQCPVRCHQENLGKSRCQIPPEYKKTRCSSLSAVNIVAFAWRDWRKPRKLCQKSHCTRVWKINFCVRLCWWNFNENFNEPTNFVKLLIWNFIKILLTFSQSLYAERLAKPIGPFLWHFSFRTRRKVCSFMDKILSSFVG
jgi:hypothetical protein